MEKQGLNIADMSYSGSQIIRKILKKLKGIKDISLNVISEKLFAVYDENIISFEHIKTNLKNAGFDCLESLAKNETAIIISGINSEASAQGLEKMIEKMDGIEKASIDFESGKAVIRYDDSKVRISTVKDRIVKAGYKTLDIFKKDFAYIDQVYKQKSFNIALRDFIISLIFLLPLLYIASFSVFIYIEMPLSDILSPVQYPLRFALFQLMFLIAIIVVAHKIFIRAFQSIKNGSLNTEALCASAILILIIYSVYNIFEMQSGDLSAVESLYFASAGFICSIILMGKLFEYSLKNKIMEIIRGLTILIPKTAIIIKNGFEDEITIDELEIGDIIIARPGEYIPADGIVVDGSSIIDESILTGNQTPSERKIGDKVYCASLNTQGIIHIKAEKTGNDAAIFQIIKILEDFQETKSQISKSTDRAALYIAPIACVFAIAAGLFWYLSTYELQTAIITISCMLIISSSNAFEYGALSAFIVATGKAAKNNILVKNAESFYAAKKIDAIVFKKSDVFIQDKQEITDILTAPQVSSGNFLKMLASAQTPFNNIIANAVLDKAKAKYIKTIAPASFKAFKGLGIEAKINDIIVIAGNERFMKERNISIEEYLKQAEKLQSETKTAIFAAFDNKFAGIVAISNNIRSNSQEVIRELNKTGIETVMITG
ncbi:MAG: heavy metal translocating P-type ATPase, partial [Elusimicrobiota bacterium]|nr:heavy metal translocating P-type ATPase [Elusimicrobiota bacterium]